MAPADRSPLSTSDSKKAIFGFIDRQFLTPSVTARPLPLPADTPAEAADLFRAPHDDGALRIFLLSALHTGYDTKVVATVFNSFDARTIAFRSIPAAASLHRVLFRILRSGYLAFFSIRLFELISLVETVIFENFADALKTSVSRNRFARAMAIALARPGPQGLDDVGRWIEHLAAVDPRRRADLGTARQGLDLLRARLTFPDPKADRTHILRAWLLLHAAASDPSSRQARALATFPGMMAGLSIRPRRRPADSIRSLHRPAVPATPVFPDYPSGRTTEPVWRVPEGTGASGRSPFEASTLIRVPHGTAFPDGTICIDDTDDSWLVDGGMTTDHQRSPGLLECRSTLRQPRELGRIGDLTAIDTRLAGGRLHEGRFFLASVINFQRNFGHFVYQMLPNIVCYRDVVDDGGKIVFFGARQPFHDGFLDYVGVERDAVVFLQDPDALTGELAFFEESFGSHVNLQRVAAMRSVVAPPDPGASPFGKRIYLSRRRTAHRPSTNELEMEALVARYGFDVVVQDGRPSAEQIAILENADVILGAHGSAFTPLVFCRRPKTIIEGHSKTRPHQTVYMHLLGNRVYWTAMGQAFSADGQITYDWNLDEVETLLRTLLG